VGLVPGQSRLAFGIEVLVIGVVLLAVVLGTTLNNLGGSDRMQWRVSLIGYALVACVPGVVAGISITAGEGGGLY
jgi:hypothetical protein